ncbi:MAG: hypothetical protein QXH27_05100 [Candidatus Micrarchaeia archaeon]
MDVEKEEERHVSAYSSLADLLKVFVPKEALERLDNPKGLFERFMKWSGLDFIARRNIRTADGVFFGLVEELTHEERKHLENVAAAYPGGVAEQMILRYAELARQKGRSEASILELFPSLKKKMEEKEKTLKEKPRKQAPFKRAPEREPVRKEEKRERREPAKTGKGVPA